MSIQWASLTSDLATSYNGFVYAYATLPIEFSNTKYNVVHSNGGGGHGSYMQWIGVVEKQKTQIRVSCYNNTIRSVGRTDNNDIFLCFGI